MIPKVLHYCFGMARDFGEKPWSLVHYVCLRSAVERLRPEKVLFYFEYEPTGPWWNLTREMVTPVAVKAPREIFGIPVIHPAHRSDIVRLERLLEVGGIYLDADVFVQRDFDNLLHHRTVLGKEGFYPQYGLCNAVILSEPEAPFLRRWYNEYRTFRGKSLTEHWNEHSVEVPLRLAREHPSEITVLAPTAFFWPTWEPDGIDRIYRSPEKIDLFSAYANHLWESVAWEAYLEDLTPGLVRSRWSNFHCWARPLVTNLTDDYGYPSSRIARLLRQSKRISRRYRDIWPARFGGR
jgi:hypothetical protein